MNMKFLFMFLGIGIVSFIFGTFWQTLYYGYFGQIPQHTFICFNYSNFFQSYQTNCDIPSLSQKPFHFSHHLFCQAITNQQLYDRVDAMGKPMPGKEAMLIKNDYVHFTLDFHDKTLIQSVGVGQTRTEAYTIIKDSHDIIQAVQPVKLENLDIADSYTFITISKKTGKGMEVWHNLARTVGKLADPDSIGSHFFQCQ